MTTIHDTADLVSKALRRAWQLGQTYWQQADSEYQSHWKKADATQATFDQLVEDTRAAILTSNSGAQPAPSGSEQGKRKISEEGDGIDWIQRALQAEAKIEQMEQQEPVAWAATDETCRIVEALSFNQSRRFDTPLYALPGAQGESE